jgi:signal transduction histidine kinase
MAIDARDRRTSRLPGTSLSLFWRIFLAFWLVIVLSIIATVFLNDRLDQARQQDGLTNERVERMAREVRIRVLRELNRGGPQALARWGRTQARGNQRIELLILDGDAREINDRRIPTPLNPLTEAWRRARPLPDLPRGARRLAEVNHASHGRFLVLALTPPRPLLLRLFGPLGPLGLLAVALSASALISWLLARTLSRPIRRIRASGRALGRGELSARVDGSVSRRRDELGELATDFNAMADRIQALMERQQSLLRDVSHELRSPLARMRMALALAEQSGRGDAQDDYFARMARDIERLDRLIEDILRYTRINQCGAPDPQPVDLASLCQDLIDSAQLEAAPRSIKLAYSGPSALSVRGQPELLERALENLLRNAIAHSPDLGRVVLSLSKEKCAVVLHVLDEGPGVPDDQLSAIFEPFVRLSPERGENGQSGGIGLAIVKAAIGQHGGSVRASNRAGGGLDVRIELPASGSTD